MSPFADILETLEENKENSHAGGMIATFLILHFISRDLKGKIWNTALWGTILGLKRR